MSDPDPDPRVSVILPCRNEVRGIERCIQSILAQQAPKGGFELIIADGMSDDGTRDILSRLQEEVSGRWSVINGLAPTVSGPSLRVINNPSRVTPTALNAAMKAARGDIIVRIDAHTEYATDYICRCVETLENTGADNVGGPWIARGEAPISRTIAAAFQSPFAVGGARGHDPNHEGKVDTVYLGCWHKEAFKKFGYFDEELLRNQDDEHNLRIVRGGGKVYQSPTIRSWYKPRGSLSELFRQYRQYGYWKVRVIQKHKLPASWRHLVPATFVLTLALLFLLSLFSFLFSAPTSVSSGLQVSGFRFHPSLIFQLSAFSFLLLASSYFLALITASLVTASRSEWKLLPLLPLVFPCYHFGYGIGFLRGIWDFMILRRGAKAQFTTLTR